MHTRRYRNRRRRRKYVIAYIVRAVAVLAAVTIIIFVVYGGFYIYGNFIKHDKAIKADVFASQEGEADIPSEDDMMPDTSAEDEGKKYCVVIDAGHGGKDGGTVSGEVVEKDINLSVALKLKAVLEESDIDVILTRSSDEKVSLSQRTSAANNAQADFFISLHCNYYEEDNRVAGLECFYNSPEDAESKVYAESIMNAVSQSDEIKTRSAKAEDYYVLNHSLMPSVLVEMGFLSNDSECRKLLSDEYQEELSQRIADGILQELIPEPSDLSF